MIGQRNGRVLSPNSIATVHYQNALKRNPRVEPAVSTYTAIEGELKITEAVRNLAQHIVSHCLLPGQPTRRVARVVDRQEHFLHH